MWLMLNKHLLGKGLLWTFKRTWGQTTHHWKDLEGCSTGPGNCLHGYGVHSALVPPTPPGSPYLLDVLVFHCVFMTSQSLYTCLFGIITTTTSSFCTATAMPSVPKLTSPIIISPPFWKKMENLHLQMPEEGKSPSSNAWRKSLFGCGFYLKLNTPPMPTQDGNSFQFPHLGQCRDLLSSSSDLSLSFSISWNCPQIKTLLFDLDFCICCPDSGPYYCIFNTKSSSAGIPIL